jgi:hypothetical protein
MGGSVLDDAEAMPLHGGSMTKMVATPYFEVSVDVGFIRARRTSLAFDSIESMEQEARRLEALIDELGREGRGILIDSRESPLPHPDEAFDRAHVKIREATSRGFDRVAVVVESAIGVLQVNRLVRVDARGGVQTFQSIEAAEAYARGR